MLLTLVYDFIHDAIFHSFFCSHEIVALTISFNNFNWFAGVFSKYVIELMLDSENMLCLNLNISALALATAGRLMNHDFCIR